MCDSVSVVTSGSPQVQACEAQLAVSARGARGGALTGARSAAADRVQMLTELTSELHARAGPSEEVPGPARGSARRASWLRVRRLDRQKY